MSDNISPVMIAVVYALISAVWLTAIAAGLIVPRYALRFRVPWPVLAGMILVLMVIATVVTLAAVRLVRF